MDIQYLEFETNRKFGVELEVGREVEPKRLKAAIKKVSKKPIVVTDKWDLSTNNSYWHIKSDSSCGAEPDALGRKMGYEIASFIASGKEDRYAIATVAEQIKIAKALVNDNCGFHIHVDISDFSHEDVGKLMAYWLKIEDVLLYSMPVRRFISSHCKMFWSHVYNRAVNRKMPYSGEELWALLGPKSTSIHDNDYKKFNLNLVNYLRAEEHYKYASRKTVEFRWPEGTLDSRDIINWIYFCLYFVELCKNYSMPENLVAANFSEALEIMGLENKSVFNILSAELLDLKIWFLERVLINYWCYGGKQIGKLAKNKLNFLTEPY